MCGKSRFIDLSKENLLDLSNMLWDMSKREYKEKYKYDAIKDILIYRRTHSKVTADLAESMFDNNFNKEYNKDQIKYLKNVLYLASLTHDIRKLDKRHASSGAEWMYKKLQGIRYSYTDETGNFIEVPIVDINTSNLVCTLIEMHKGRKSEKINRQEEAINEDIKLLVLFIRLADKLSKLVVESNLRKINVNEINTKVDEVFNKYTLSVTEFNVAEIVDNVEKKFIEDFCNKETRSYL